MKKPIIIASWKMNLSFKQEKDLAQDFFKKIKKVNQIKEIEIVLCPSFISLSEIAKIFKPSNELLSFGAQDCFWEERGSFTGEISPSFLGEIGCRYVIVGHSERRKNLKETEEMIHKKVKAVLKAGLIPIICIGETREERDKNIKEQVIISQITSALEGIHLKADQKIVLAYEPVWVIGSGRAIDPEEVEYMSKIILQRTVDLFPLSIVKNNIRVAYGGSVDSKSIEKFLKIETIDGVLVGGASLDSEEFIKICKIFSNDRSR